MKYISKPNNLSKIKPKRINKRGLSAIIAYVLLISMAIALSTMIYNWLKFYVEIDEVEQCPEGISLVISDYDCNAYEQKISITLKNRGRWTVDGFNIRVHDREDATQGLYNLNKTAAGGAQISKLAPGESATFEYDFPCKDEYCVRELEDISIVEVQPFVIYENAINKSFCQPIVTQTVECSSSSCSYGEYDYGGLCIPSPISYWSFDEDFSDTVGNNDGSPEGNAEIIDNYLSLDGVDSFVDFGDISAIEQITKFSIVGWIKMGEDALDSDNDLFTKGPHETTTPILIWRDDIVGGGNQVGNTNTLSVSLYSGSTQYWISAPSESLNDTSWHHVAITVDSGETNGLKIYIDGNPEQSGSTLGFSGVNNNAYSFIIGAPSNSLSQIFDGSIDEVMIWDRALSSDEISEIFNADRQ